ncbi:GFA family protein [Corallincola luteus]|uniref:GFA family protein n=1 Tax=Corallincola luteus TaxID=1775177 RepID=A0ABY2AHY6_9GAMM|nr:GFA family protein [Corallincola luteus]TCI02248.1 GFA family protein [Corallincola luteus]
MIGKCLCGSVEFEINKDHIKLYQCHCQLCRKQSGTYSNAATIVPTSLFKLVKGQSQIRSWVKQTGFRSDFCQQCGSPVPNPLRDTPYYWVPAGLIEDIGDAEVISHLFVGSKASWDKPNPDADTHFAFPEHGLQEHIEQLNNE